MEKKRSIKKSLFALLMLLMVVFTTTFVTSAYSDSGVIEDDCDNCALGCEDCLNSSEMKSASIPYAAASGSSKSKNPDNYPYPNRNLIYSGGPTAQCIGDDVRWLQSVLVHLDYKLDVDGSYGPETRDTIKKFQKAYGLTVDGMSGPKTRPKLREIWQKTGHTWDSGTVTKQPQIGVAGIKTYKCVYCEKEKTGFISPLQGPSVPTSKQYKIGENIFKENIDQRLESIGDSSIYDPVFSNMLIALAKAAYVKSDIIDAHKSLGFNEPYVNDYETEDSNKCGSVISIKKAENSNDIICLVTLRGSTGTLLISSDWRGNYKIATTDQGKHLGFSLAADTIYRYIELILSDNGGFNNVKFVISGHSRGGAIGNLLAVKLMENNVSPDNVYNYNYACPDVACVESFTYYDNIFNICNTEDTVSWLPGAPCSLLTGLTGAYWIKFGQTIRFTLKSDFLGDHDSELYLEFLNQQKDIDDWPLRKTNWYNWITIFCPVDAIVTDENGKPIASVINGEISYYDSNVGDVFILTSGDKKMIYVHGDDKYNVDLIATDTGTMTYAVESGNLSTGEIHESKTFNNVVLEKGKTMHSPVSKADSVEDVELFVTEEKDGKIRYTHSINTDGTEEIYSNNLWEKIKNMPEKTKRIIVYVVGGIVVLSLLDAMLGRRKAKKKKKMQKQQPK